MQLIDPNQSPTAHALEIQQLLVELRDFSVSHLNRIFALANTSEMEQAILNRIGTQAGPALAAYQAMQGAVNLVAPGKVPAADPAVFVAQPDGTVLYVAPPEAPVPDAP